MKSRITGFQAFAHMHAWLLQHRNGFKGHCHKTCQDAWGLPVMYASAIDAWNHVPANHRHTDLSRIPIGAPIFFSGGEYGHVALQTDRRGYVISTDAPTPDFIGEVRIDWFAKHWGKKVLGWASQYNGVDLQLTQFPDGTHVSHTHGTTTATKGGEVKVTVKPKKTEPKKSVVGKAVKAVKKATGAK